MPQAIQKIQKATNVKNQAPANLSVIVLAFEASKLPQNYIIAPMIVLSESEPIKHAAAKRRQR